MRGYMKKFSKYSKVFIQNTIYHILYTSPSGFTLIELLIAISISTLLVSGGIISYRDFNHKQTVQGAGLTVKSALRDIQSKAMSGEKPVDTPCAQLIGYEVSFTQNQLQSAVRCTNGTSPVQTAYTLPSRVTLSSTTPSFVFNALGQGVTQPATISIVGFNKQYQLNILQTGEIRDDDFVPFGSTPAPSSSGQASPTPVPLPTATPAPTPSPAPSSAELYAQYSYLFAHPDYSDLAGWAAQVANLYLQYLNSLR